MVAVLLRGGGGEGFWQYFWSIFIFLCSLASNHRIKMLQAASLHSSKDSTARLSVAKVSTKSDVSLVSPTLDSLITETQFANFKSKERRGSFSQREKLSLIKSPRNRKSSKSVIRMAFKSLKLSWIASTFRLEMQINVTWMRFLHKPSHAHF